MNLMSSLFHNGYQHKPKNSYDFGQVSLVVILYMSFNIIFTGVRSRWLWGRFEGS